MSDRILARHILEGMLHNINNHLNLILGYSQTLGKKNPGLREAAKIYDAGIKIDDTLKDLSRQLWDRSFAFAEQQDLSLWLDNELRYLNHYLPVKHHIIFDRDDLTEGQKAMIAGLDMSVWYEDKLLKLSKLSQRFKLQTGITTDEGMSALYLIPEIELDEGQLSLLCQDPVCEMMGDSKFPIESRWDPSDKMLKGLIHER